MRYSINGFPEISEAVEMPSIGELLVAPMLSFATPEEVRQYGSAYIRDLFDKAPLKNDRKYVFVNSVIQFLTPNVRTIANQAKEGGNNWHMDAFSLSAERPDRYHILFSECTALTEFNTVPFTLDMEDTDSPIVVNNYINENEDALPMVGKKVPPCTFASFTTHLHRRTTPQCNEFRYWLRIFETDTYPEQRKGTPYRNTSFVVSAHGMRYAGKNDAVFYPNIEQTKDGKIIISIT